MQTFDSNCSTGSSVKAGVCNAYLAKVALHEQYRKPRRCSKNTWERLHLKCSISSPCSKAWLRSSFRYDCHNYEGVIYRQCIRCLDWPLGLCIWLLISMQDLADVDTGLYSPDWASSVTHRTKKQDTVTCDAHAHCSLPPSRGSTPLNSKLHQLCKPHKERLSNTMDGP